MRTIADKFTKIVELNRSEEIPENLIRADCSSAIVKIDDQLLQIKNNPVFSSISEFKTDDKDKFIEKTFGELKYSSDNPVVLRENFKDYKIPADLFRYAMKYFRELFKEHGSESAILLMLNPKTKDWQLLPVLQTGEHSAVDYYRPLPKDANLDKNKDEYEYKEIFKNNQYWKLMEYSLKIYQDLYKQGYSLFGSIHSHADFEAFHSGVDDADEIDFDGLHITIGNVNKNFSYSARWMISQAEFPQDILDIVDVKDLDTLSENIDSVKLQKKDLELFVKDLNIKRSYGYNYGSNYKYNQHGFHRYNIEPKYYNKRSPSMWNPDTNQYDEEKREWLDSGPPISNAPVLDGVVIIEMAGQRLYDLVEDVAFWVEAKFYNENKELFPDDRYIELEDPPVPSKKIKKAKRHLQNYHAD